MGVPENLQAFQLAFKLACEIQLLTKRFPKEEKYSLTDQIRRSSRSVCANLLEGYRKRIYPKSFISKLSDCAGENAETSLWLDFAKEFGYVSQDEYERYKAQCNSIGRLLSFMMKHLDRFC
ncbi:MAG: four helix bundle protein [Bacteroidota bacterium]